MFKFNNSFRLQGLLNPRLAVPWYSGEFGEVRDRGYWSIRNKPGNSKHIFDVLQDYERSVPELEAFKNPPLLGIEIEAEYISSNWMKFLSSEWGWVEDGSLRHNGLEFISQPLYPENLRGALCGLWSLFESWQPGKLPKFGWRTSVHVHMNMLDKTTDHLVKMLLVYIAFEESLFEFGGPNRKESIFCVPITRTNFSWYLRRVLNGISNLDVLILGTNKYSALNLSPLKSFGTIEFRAMEGTSDLSRIVNWIGILTKMDEYCQNTHLDKIVKEIKLLNTNSRYDLFKQDVFGHYYSHLIDTNQTQPHMSDCIKYAKECLSAADLTHNPYELPRESALFDYYQKQKSAQEGLV